MKKLVTAFKVGVSVFGVYCAGAYTALAIEYGIDVTIGAGLGLAIILAICAGIGAYEDIKCEEEE
jgi:hypothetical protein